MKFLKKIKKAVADFNDTLKKGEQQAAQKTNNAVESPNLESVKPHVVAENQKVLNEQLDVKSKLDTINQNIKVVPSETKKQKFDFKKLKKQKFSKSNTESNSTLKKQDAKIKVLAKRTKTGLKTWALGVIKEFSRVVWLKPKAFWEQFGVTLAVTIFLGIIFYIVFIITSLI